MKVTNRGLAGMTYEFGEPVPATPSEYLDRWLLQNEIFGDTAELEGIIVTDYGSSLVISQRWIVGDVPTGDEIMAGMNGLGFECADLPECFYHPADNLAVMDCHDGNFVMLESGMVVPIDVIPVHPDAILKQRLGFHP